jgi:hypothetical protein
MAEVILVQQGTGERHGKSGIFSGDHSGALSDSLWGDVHLGCQKVF